MTSSALVLSGSLGHGHDTVAQASVDVLAAGSWSVRLLDSMDLLGPRAGRAGERVFRRLLAVDAAYDALHFAHLRAGSRLAELLDGLATGRIVRALAEQVDRAGVELVLSVFPTGASAAARLRAERPALHTVVLCPDVTAHRLWVRDGTELFLVTSPAAAASVRRYLPRAHVRVLPLPVRPAFYTAPDRATARAALGLPADARCVLLIGGGWGLGPLPRVARTLAASGVRVLAVGGRNPALTRRLAALAAAVPEVTALGYTDRVPELMAAADLVVTVPGAATCAEARVVGRPLLLLDAVPGHGRENLLHELELGADACSPVPEQVSASVLAALDRPPPAVPARSPDEFRSALADALASIGVQLEVGI